MKENCFEIKNIKVESSESTCPLRTYAKNFDGREIAWTSAEFDRGMEMFDFEEYVSMGRDLIGIESIQDIRERASQNLCPYASKSFKGEIFPDRPSVVMHTANRESAFFELDKQALLQGRTPGGYDINIADRAFVMTQTGNDARPGDVIVGRGELMDMRINRGDAVVLDEYNFQTEEIKVLDAGNMDLYHMTDALLVEAMKRKSGEVSQLDPLISYLAQNEDAIVRLYASDISNQLLLLYVLEEVKKLNPNIANLNVEANSPEISSLNRKDVLYPEIGDVEVLDFSDLETASWDVSALSECCKTDTVIKQERYEMLRRESGISELGRYGLYETTQALYSANSIDIPFFAPGYTITQSSKSEEVFVQDNLKAFDRLAKTYGLDQVCFKWSRASDGENTIPFISTDESGRERLMSLARDAYASGQDVCVVAHADYLTTLDGRDTKLTPSVHILGGYPVRDVITEQTLVGQQWVGNAVLSRSDFVEMAGADVDERENFARYFDAMGLANEAIALCMGDKGVGIMGNDFGVFHLGGVFGNDVFVSIQDNNWRFTGAFMAHAAHELAKQRLGRDDVATMTRVIDVGERLSYANVDNICTDLMDELGDDVVLRVVTVTPGWSMVSASSVGDQRRVRDVMSVLLERIES